MLIIAILIAVFLVTITLLVAYLYILAAVSLSPRRKQYDRIEPYRFLILIPAHNEENGISSTLNSLKLIDLPGETTVAVIADNCSDRTAELAREVGSQVLERTDELNRGKGYALEWAIAQYDLDNFDAVAIVDADTQVRPNMLTAMARQLQAGHGAVQLNYRFVGQPGSPLAILQEMASHVENMLFYRGRAILDLPILLRGSGMAIRADILQAHPWDSHSITEDVDYAVNLIRKGVSIAFSTESAVDSEATTSYKQSQGQKKRWASGTILMIRQKALPLLWQGLTKGRLELVELATSFLLLSRPALIYITLPMLLLSIFAPDGTRLTFFLWVLFLIIALIFYLLLGLFYVKDKGSAIKALMHIPAYAIWYLKVTLGAAADHKQSDWVRTDRNESE